MNTYEYIVNKYFNNKFNSSIVGRLKNIFKKYKRLTLI